MKVILLKDVKKQGKKDDIIDVSDGYARNYLIKNNLAVPVTKRSKEVLDIAIEKKELEEEALVKSLNEIKNKLENKEISFVVKTGKEDKVFGVISSKQISEELKKMGFDIDKKCIKIDGSISSLGTHEVLVSLHKKVSFKIKVILRK